MVTANSPFCCRPSYADHEISSGEPTNSHPDGRWIRIAFKRENQFRTTDIFSSSLFSAASNKVSKRKKVAAMRSYLTFSIAVMLPLLAGAQNPPTAPPPTTASPATSLRLLHLLLRRASACTRIRRTIRAQTSSSKTKTIAMLRQAEFRRGSAGGGPGSSNCGTTTGCAAAGCATGRKRRTERRCGEGFCKGCSRRRSSRRHRRRCRDWCCCWCDCRRNGRAPLEEESQEGLRAAGSATNSSSSAARSG